MQFDPGNFTHAGVNGGFVFRRFFSGWSNGKIHSWSVLHILGFNNVTLNLNQHLHSTIAVRSVWLEIACPTAYYVDLTGGWADPKTASARVQCCDDDGECKRKNDNDECYWQGNAKFYAAKKICKFHGKRLCTKAEILSLDCCKKGCKMNPKLAWTSDTSTKGVVREKLQFCRQFAKLKMRMCLSASCTPSLLPCP